MASSRFRVQIKTAPAEVLWRGLMGNGSVDRLTHKSGAQRNNRRSSQPEWGT